jgi:hypothetical protein
MNFKQRLPIWDIVPAKSYGSTKKKIERKLNTTKTTAAGGSPFKLSANFSAKK